MACGARSRRRTPLLRSGDGGRVVELDVLTLSIAVLAAGLAAVALVLVVRGRDSSGDVSSARVAEQERRLAAAVRRLESLEREVDGRAPASSVDGGPVAHPPRTGTTISRIGLVRFDAFDDTGGAQSFALALLDGSADGIVLTSLHSRQATRLYVKAIRRGAGDAPLSDEELRALEEAGVRPEAG